MSTRTARGSILLWVSIVLTSPSAHAQKLDDLSFVGNWMVFFNPTGGGGTQTLTVDINAAGSYIATDMHESKSPVVGRFEAKGGKFRLLGKDGLVLDEGTYEPFGPQLQLTSPRGKGHWSKVSAESKQGDAISAGLDLKAAKFEPLAAEAINAARSKWKKDAILVEAKVIPNANGTLDLTTAGGNGYLRFLSPKSGHGCLGLLGNFGETNLFPEDKPVSASPYAIPSNVISLEDAMRIAQKEKGTVVTDAALFGSGTETDLRQFCWVLTTQDSVIAVDAILGGVTNYPEFMNGRPRAIKVPFTPNSGFLSYQSVYDGSGPPEVMWYVRHVVFLEGLDEAIIVRVPWRIVPDDELRKHATQSPDGIRYRADSELYPSGETVPLSGAMRDRFLRDQDSIALDCPPGGVRTEKALSVFPAGTKERIRSQLEAHWRSKGGR